MNKKVLDKCLVLAYRKARSNYLHVDAWKSATGEQLMIHGEPINKKWWANIVIVALRSNKRYKQQQLLDKESEVNTQWKK